MRASREFQEQFKEAQWLLRELIKIESLSTQESERANFLTHFFADRGFAPKRVKNNLILHHPAERSDAKTLMLNSHIDTVKEAAGYSFDPFNPPIERERILGLGSNDAGGALVSMIATFLLFAKGEERLPFNLLLLLSAEEENSGRDGIALALKECREVDGAIIGEPTSMRCAVAERGLLVIDGEAKGISGHAARDEGQNALYIAIEDIERLRGYRFDKLSPQMGEVKLTVTALEAGKQHNVIPDRATFVVDIRTTDCYSNSEIMELLSPLVKSTLRARNLKNRSSATPLGHPLISCAESLGIERYISPTTSDWMRIEMAAIKMGPGDTARSHTADEYILVEEIEEGIEGYIKFIRNLKL